MSMTDVSLLGIALISGYSDVLDDDDVDSDVVHYVDVVDADVSSFSGSNCRW